MNIDKLVCGDELDKLIAEKVFGFTDFGYYGKTLMGRYRNDAFYPILEYSFDPSAALKIVCEINLFDNGRILYRDEDEMWVVANLNSESVKFDEFEHSTYWVEPEVIAKGDSIPLVICKAALKIIGEK